jgi:hypothetical protein
MHKLKDYLCNEVYKLEDKLTKDGKLSRTDVEDLKLLVKDYNGLCEMKHNMEDEEYSMSMGRYPMRGYSRRMSYDDGVSYADDGRGDFVRPDGSYRDDGMSYARGRGRNAKRDSMGRYSSASEDMRMGLERLMDTATDEHTRSEIRKLMEKM